MGDISFVRFDISYKRFDISYERFNISYKRFDISYKRFDIGSIYSYITKGLSGFERFSPCIVFRNTAQNLLLKRVHANFRYCTESVNMSISSF